MSRIDLPHEFPNEFGKRGGELLYENGEVVPSLAWVGFKREKSFKNMSPEEALSGERMPQYLIMTPGVMAYQQDGTRRAQILSTHEVWISMS